MRKLILICAALAACSPSESLPTACNPACAAGEVCVNAQCLVQADGGSDTAPADAPGGDAAPDVTTVDSGAADVGADIGGELVIDAGGDAAPEAAADVAPDAITCPTGRADCDGNAANGCEADTQGDRLNCGTCRRMCPSPDGASPTCTLGACTIRCDIGFGDCDGNAANGCENRLDNDSRHCGSCSNNCGGRACVAGVCR